VYFPTVLPFFAAYYSALSPQYKPNLSKDKTTQDIHPLPFFRPTHFQAKYSNDLSPGRVELLTVPIVSVIVRVSTIFIFMAVVPVRVLAIITPIIPAPVMMFILHDTPNIAKQYYEPNYSK